MASQYSNSSHEKLASFNKTLMNALPDYHVLVYPIIQAFYAKDLVETDFDSLKKLVASMMNGEKLGII